MATSSGSLQCLWLVILAAVLVQSLAVVLSFVFFNRVLHTMQGGSVPSCLADPNLLRSDYGALAAEVDKTDPCWQVLEQLRYHIEQTATERLQAQISSAVTNEQTGVPPFLSDDAALADVAAHVTAAVASSQTEGASSSRGYLGERVTAWEGRRGQSFLQNVELRGGELLVPRAGLYYIYAQTYFRLTSTWPTEEEEQEEEGGAEGEEPQEQDGAQLVQYIYKKMSSYTVPILLMKSSRSACWPRGQEPGLFSLNQAGTAFLQPTDRLFITVSNASAMEMDGRASYFGAFLVG
ncbi:tumor necrosis factor ligand superfamily member 10-like [Dunckerocampus dactyliophorus]|uniref:tumor necrosis factor ligand superfamily member 10-like n=1 Tax=Dunckerocampus dactyliophorus TaxID=161453 RepID=UPI0024064A35|nr:tumor necrosis factor ligand superfamily member 10-like [Dunckerocampus dactyliophorus]